MILLHKFSHYKLNNYTFKSNYLERSLNLNNEIETAFEKKSFIKFFRFIRYLKYKILLSWLIRKILIIGLV